MYYTLIIEDRNGIIANELTFEQGSFTIGRVDGNDVQLASGTVSRRHARLFTDSGRCFVEDLNSSNGVLLDGQRIVGTAELASGSQIRIGDYLLVLKSRAARAVAGGGPSPFSTPAPRPRGQRPGVHESLMYPRLVRVGDALEGETFALTERENAVGRTDDNIVLLSDASVSRKHAKIIVDAGRYVIQDLGSSNGTRVNNQDVRQPTLVHPGDVVRFGSVRFALAAPGQTVDLREYNRFLASSSRGLVVAVTVLALLLVLVASGIGIFVVLDRRDDESAPQESGLSAIDRARTLKAEGDALAAAEQWNEAIVKYELALNFDPQYDDAAVAMRRAQAEFNSSRTVQEADMSLVSAERTETGGDPEESLQLYERARTRLMNVPPESAYYRSAQDRVSMLIDPALIRLHRTLGAQRFEANGFSQAAHHYRQALDIWQALPEDRRSDIVDDLRNRLWRSLISAGDAAYEAEAWSQAVTFYEQAQLMGELRNEAAERLNSAREHL